jgi:dihydrofolate synthase/folylpolyglutamate synthase
MPSDILQRLFARRRFGMRPGLGGMRALLARLENPESGLAVVHIAGTNGKGSVAALVSEVLSAAGLRVGRYTSPHLLRVNERFFVDGRPVDDATLLAVAAQVESAANAVEQAGGSPPTFFECATAMAFVLFQRAGIRLAVVETGLGGAQDATNVMTPLVSVITRIGLDHCEQLGHTIEAIAREKAGIVKPRRPVVCGAMPDEARAVVRRAAAEQGCPFIDATEDVTVTAQSAALDGLTARIATASRDLGTIHTPLAGAYQIENLATAAAALEAVAEQLGLEIQDEAFRTGFGRVCWPGRFQLALREPPVIVDGAHNPDGAAALRDALKRTRFRGPVALIAGFCDDKDAGGFLRLLAPVVRRVWCVPVPSPRSLSAASAADTARAAGCVAVEASEFVPALAAAQRWARQEHGLVVVCGSLFLAGQALEHLHAFPWPLGADVREADPNEALKR